MELKIKPMLTHGEYAVAGVPMSHQWVGIFVALTQTPEDQQRTWTPEDQGLWDEMIREPGVSFPIKVLAKRFEIVGCKYHPLMLMLLAIIANGNPGFCVCLAHALNIARVKRGSDVVTADDFVQCWPMTIPSREGFEHHWDNVVKASSHNIDEMNDRAIWPRLSPSETKPLPGV